ncbi:MAG: PD-(D/E)XK nuclease family protein, partial [bacterium]
EGGISPAGLQRAADDLRAARGPGDREDAAWLRDLALLADSFRARLGELGLFDDGLLFERACARAEEAPPRVPTLVYGFADMNAVQRRLVAACCREAEAAAFLPAEPEAPACAFAAPLLEWFASQGFERSGGSSEEEGPFEDVGRRLFGPSGAAVLAEGAALPKGALRVVSAPLESREVFELVREILRGDEGETAARGEEAAPRGAAGVLLPYPGDYPGLFRETFRALGVSAEMEDAGALDGAAAGRTLIGMLELGERSYGRAEVMRFLDEGSFCESAAFRGRAEFAEILGGEADPLLPARWERLSRNLGFLAGREGWSPALARAAKKEKAEDLPALQSLALAVEEVFARLGDLPERGGLAGRLRAARAAFADLTGPLEEKEEALAALEPLEDLAPILGEIGAREFRRWVRAALEKARLRGPERPGRLSVLSLTGARGIPFETVVMPGMTEGRFPAGGMDDPLLPDRLRARLNRALPLPGGGGGGGGGAGERLPLKTARTAESRFLFWTALQAAERRVVLGYSQGGEADESERAPSIFLHHLADALGAPPGEEFPADLMGHRAAPAALDAEVLAGRAVSLLEHDLSRLMAQASSGRAEKGALAYLLRVHPAYGRLRGAVADRWRRDALTGQDGVLADPEVMKAISQRSHPSNHPVAVTALENFFRCPYRFALGSLLGLGEREEPAPPVEAGHLLRGSLFHDALRRFLVRWREAGGPLGDHPPARRRLWLEESVRAALGRAEREGEALLPLAWRALGEAVVRDLDAYFGEAYGEGSEWTPEEMEVSFGREEHPPIEAPAGREGEILQVSGRYDLLERGAEGVRRFVDFKSGRVSGKKTPALEGGARLQLDLYARHGAARFGEDARVRGAYAFVSERGGYEIREADEETLAGRRGAVEDLLGHFLRAFEGGCFFPAPSSDCNSCDFVTVCGPERSERAERKKAHPLWMRRLKLREETR